MVVPEAADAPRPAGSRRSARWAIPIALALSMFGLVALAATGASQGGTSAVIAPSQYNAGSGSTNPFSDPFVVAGVALGVLVIVFAILLAFRLQGRNMGGGRSEETPPGDDGETSSSAKEADEGQDGEDSPSPEEGEGS
jgi:hypothetical protein